MDVNKDQAGALQQEKLLQLFSSPLLSPLFFLFFLPFPDPASSQTIPLLLLLAPDTPSLLILQG